MKRFEVNDGWAHSSHIAMSLLMALFPFCIFSLSLAVQLSLDFSNSDLVEFILGTWPDQLSEPIGREIKAVFETSGPAKLTISAVLAIYCASNGVEAIRTSITGAYNENAPRPFWKTRLLCIVFVVAGALALSAAGALMILFPAIFEFFTEASADLYTQVFSSGPLLFMIALLLLIVFLVACHLCLPVLRRPFSSIIPGVALTIILRAICGQYIKNFGSYSVTYAGLAGIMASLVYTNLTSAILILGAEFNCQLCEETAEPRTPSNQGKGTVRTKFWSGPK